MTPKPLNLALLLSSNSDYNQLKKPIKDLQFTNEVYFSRNMNHLNRIIAQQEIDVLMVSNGLLGNTNFQKLAKINQEVKTIILLQDNSNNFPAAFLPFYLIHESLMGRSFPNLMTALVEGNHWYDSRIAEGMKIHKLDLSAPSDYGITPHEIDVLNGYLSGNKICENANRLQITSNTYNTIQKNIREKLGLSSAKELIPFLRKKHWCHFESGEIIWF